MEHFEKYISRQAIILQLCNIRAKIADKRKEKHLFHLLTKNNVYNYHINVKKNHDLLDQAEKQIMDLLPPRRKWKKLKKKHRYTTNNQRINSIDYNKKSLLITINHYSDDPCLKALNEFIVEIQSAINDPQYLISPPKIVPVAKNKKKPNSGVYRPISRFSLKDQIIIGVTNKYLTDVFDEYFDDECSFAFRSAKRGQNLDHHEAVNSILKYRNEITEDHLWVAECDISKFFDCLHHTMIKKQFKRLKGIIKKTNPNLPDSRAERIFYRYLQCYSFPKNVHIYNQDSEKGYWKTNRIKNGVYEWEEEKLNELKCFKKVHLARVGVPQGGALSGLISNLVMDYADRLIKKLKDPLLHYVRFCDDMVILHPKKDRCGIAADTYFKAIQRLHLIPCEFYQEKLENTRKSFWNTNVKSKGPYRWSSAVKNSFPWFGFVGYEMHFDGYVRVRRKTLQKEKRKQKNVVENVIRAVNKSQRKSRHSVFESAANRLIGMSVGRVTIKNYKTIQPDLCWAKSFRMLNSNSCSKSQMKDLDRYRNKQLARLVRELGKSNESQKITGGTITKFIFTQIRGISDVDSARIRQQMREKSVLNKNYKLNNEVPIYDPKLDLGLSPEYERYRHEVIEVLKNPITERYVSFYGKPFSYYYHLMERKSE